MVSLFLATPSHAERFVRGVRRWRQPQYLHGLAPCPANAVFQTNHMDWQLERCTPTDDPGSLAGTLGLLGQNSRFNASAHLPGEI